MQESGYLSHMSIVIFQVQSWTNWIKAANNQFQDYGPTRNPKPFNKTDLLKILTLHPTT